MEERDTQVDGTKTPELLVDFITSLDGYGAAEGWPGWWGFQGPEYLAWLGKQPEAGYTVLMGANTYRLMRAVELAGTSDLVLDHADALLTLADVLDVRGLGDDAAAARRQAIAKLRAKGNLAAIAYPTGEPKPAPHDVRS